MGVFEVQLIYHRGSFNNKILFHCCLLQITEYSSLCYRKVLIFNLHYIQKCVAVNADFFPLPFPFGNHKVVFYASKSISVL